MTGTGVIGGKTGTDLIAVRQSSTLSRDKKKQPKNESKPSTKKDTDPEEYYEKESKIPARLGEVLMRILLVVGGYCRE